MRQGEFAQAAPTSAGPTFLGMELGDDHPLGSLERFSASPRLDLSDPRRMRPLDLTLSGRRGVIECTTCHDPHDRVSTKPDAIEQRQICSVCHDPATYEYEGHTEQACSDCHALHGGAIGVLLAEQDPSRLCGRCHLSLAPPSTLEEARRNPARTPPAPMPGDEHVPGADCLGCHTAHKR
jgi:predicted CXXCH cytochrome family protein